MGKPGGLNISPYVWTQRSCPWEMWNMIVQLQMSTDVKSLWGADTFWYIPCQITLLRSHIAELKPLKVTGTVLIYERTNIVIWLSQCLSAPNVGRASNNKTNSATAPIYITSILKYGPVLTW